MIRVNLLAFTFAVLLCVLVPSAFGLVENGVIEMPFTENPPTIDSKWTTTEEWSGASETSATGDNHEMIILTKHDRNFIYIMLAVITDDFGFNYKKYVAPLGLVCFDTEDNGGNEQTSKDICFREEGLWIDGIFSKKQFKGEVIVGDPREEIGTRPIDTPSGYKSEMGVSLRNDPFESSRDHRIYEFQIPISSLHKADNYGFALKVYLAATDNTGGSQEDTSVYTILWPQRLTSAPSTWGSIVAIENTITVPHIPVIKTSINELDFGQIEISKKSSTKQVTISNEGTSILKISNAKTTSDFSISKRQTPIDLKPGQSTNFDIIFAPITVGQKSGSLIISSNDINKPTLSISLTGNGAEPGTTLTGGGGCLIATAVYGSEMAPQVQLLREIRDNKVMSTESGVSFMTGFNQFYYSFSPIVADLERENPVFKEAVKIAITPMLSTLSIMTLAEDGSEVEVLGLGLSVILLNLGIYVVGPVFGISKLRLHIQRKQTS